MKLHQALVVATLSLSVLAGNTSAQDSGLKFGKGRLLKKMRDDIFGSKPKFELPSLKPKTTAKKTLPLPFTGNAKVPTPALPTAGNRPTPLDAQSAHNYKTPTSKQYTIRSKDTLKTSGKASTPSVTPRTAVPRTAVAPRTATVPSRAVASKSTVTPQAIQNVKRSAKKPTLAFGMSLETQGKNLVVTNVDPAGNASKSGVRKGDTIVGAGGINFGSMYEFNEITDALQDGDQLEFVVNQGGKKATKLIAFGEVPATDTRLAAQPARSNTAASVPARTATTRNRTGSNLSQYQIAPAHSSMHSVIEAKGTQLAPAQQQSWKYNSGRRNTQVKAIESATTRGETILNLPN